MKLILLTLISVFTISSQANVHCGNPRNDFERMLCSQFFSPQDFGKAPGGACATNDAFIDPAADQDEARFILTGGRQSLPALTDRFFREGADCTGFIKSDGSYGSQGRIVYDYISGSDRRENFMNPNHIEEACPNWGNFSEREKEHFWVWTIASIAWDESRCVSGRRNTRATNGVAVGLLQLNEDRGGRSWRGPNCRVASVREDANNLKCGLDIMEELLEGRSGEYQGSGAIFRSSRRNTSYWEKLKRPNGGAIGSLIRSYPRCGVTST